MRMPLPARTGSRTRSWGASGGGKAPSSGGSVARAGVEQGDPPDQGVPLDRGRSLVVGGGHRPPVGGGGVGSVDERAHGPERRLVAEALRFQAALVEQRAERIHERQVTRRHAVEHRVRTLRLAGLRQPVPEPPAQPLAAPPGLRDRQAGGPGPAGEHHGLGGEQGAQETRPLVENVLQVESQTLRLPPGPRAGSRDLGPGLVRRPLQHQVERVAGIGEAAVEAPAGELDEARELFRSRHGARPVEAEQRHQRAVAAGEQAFACGGLGQQKALQRLAPERPARRQRVLDGPVHRSALRAWAVPRSGRRRPGRRCRRAR